MGIFIPALMLARGSQVVAADETTVLEVTRIKEYQTEQIVVLHADSAAPFKTTANHRMILPMGNGSSANCEVLAGDLQAGMMVMGSTGITRRLTKVETLAQQALVLGITFNPDQAVAAFPPPPEVIVSKGLAPRMRRPTRRSGMNRRGRGSIDRGMGEDCNLSLPDTAPGEYQD